MERVQRLKLRYLELLREDQAVTTQASPEDPKAQKKQSKQKAARHANFEALGHAAANLGVELPWLSDGAQGEACSEAALESCKLARAVAAKVHGAHSVQVADLLVRIGEAHEGMWRLDAAIRVYEDALELRSRVHGPESAAVADTLNNIGNVYQSQSEYAKALEAC